MKEEIKKARELVKTLQSLIGAAGEGKEMKKKIAGVEIKYTPDVEYPFYIGDYIFSDDQIVGIIDFYADCDGNLCDKLEEMIIE